jgi:plastocyanin
VGVGGTLTLLNLDIRRHDVVAYQVFGSDDQPWCVNFFPGQCPLFWSEEADGVGGGGSNTVEVQGLELLEPGHSYPYYCSTHESMHGTLTVLPET